MIAIGYLMPFAGLPASLVLARDFAQRLKSHLPLLQLHSSRLLEGDGEAPAAGRLNETAAGDAFLVLLWPEDTVGDALERWGGRLDAVAAVVLDDATERWHAERVRRSLLARGLAADGWASATLSTGRRRPASTGSHLGSEPFVRVEAETLFLDAATGRPSDQLRRGALGAALDRLAARAASSATAPAGARAGAEPAALASIERAIEERFSRTDFRAGGRAPAAREIDAAVEAELVARGWSAPDGALAAAQRRVRAALLGWGPLEPLLDDDAVTDILVNGPGEIYIERAGALERSPAAFRDDAHLRAVMERIAASAGRRLDFNAPLCDARLPDGSRANLVLPPVSLQGPLIALRRFGGRWRSLDDLVAAGSVDPASAAVLRDAVRGRDNIVVAGNSGAGKTTLLNALATNIDPAERIVTIEDAAELRLVHPHVVRLETRRANAEGAGEISAAALLANALRMRPDRIVVGECRGAETLAMIAAMNTGHDGGLTTLHANSVADALRRLEALLLQQAPNWPASVAREQIASAVDWIAFVKREEGRRRLTELARVSLDGGRWVVTPAVPC